MSSYSSLTVVSGTTITSAWGNAVRDSAHATGVAASRPSGTEYQHYYETDTHLERVYSQGSWRGGADWTDGWADGYGSGPDTSWTGWTSSRHYRWRRILGTTIEIEYEINLNLAPTGALTVTLPFGVSSMGVNAGQVIGGATLLGPSVRRNALFYVDPGLSGSGNMGYLDTTGGSANVVPVNATTPWTWGNGHSILISGRYRADLG